MIITTEAHPCACYLARSLKPSGAEISFINQVSPTVQWGSWQYLKRLLKHRGPCVFLDNLSYRVFYEVKTILVHMASFFRRGSKGQDSGELKGEEPYNPSSGLPALPAFASDPDLQEQAWLSWYDIDRVNSHAGRSLLTSIEADLCLLAGSPILNSSTIASAGKICLNPHCGITPDYAGSDPIIWTLINSDWERIGFTIHHVVPQIDSGPLIHQERVRWSPRWPLRYIEHVVVQRMYDQIAQVSKDLLEGRTLPSMPQSVIQVRPPAGIFSRLYAVINKMIYARTT